MGPLAKLAYNAGAHGALHWLGSRVLSTYRRGVESCLGS